MGEHFLYVNLDKKAFFAVDALGGASKSSGVGKNLGGRALGLLLLARGRDTAPRTAEGAWAGDRVAVVGETLPAGAFGDAAPAEPDPRLHAIVEATFTNLVSAVALLLLDHDGPADLLEAAKKSDACFIVLAELALVHRVERVMRALDDGLGADWPKRYAERRRASSIVVPPP